MVNRVNWHKMIPLLEGVNSTFDLFGYSNLSGVDVSKSNFDRINKNSIEYDFSMTCEYIGEAFIQYGKELKNSEY